MQNHNSDCTAVSVGHTNIHRYGKNYILYWWYKKACIPTVNWPAVLWVMHTNTRVIITELHDLCFLYYWCCVLTGRFPYERSIVWNFVVWFMFFANAGGALMLDLRFPHCWPSVWCLHLFPVDPIDKRSIALMSSFMLVQTSCWTNSGDTSESKTHETHTMFLLCNLSFRNWWQYWPCVIS